MPVVPNVQRQMTFSGDYGMDKWVSYGQASTGSVGTGGATGTVTIPHNLGYIPLVYAQWSDTIDFANPREVTQGTGDLYPVDEPWIFRTWADSVNVYFTFQNWGGAAKTVYCRIWGMPRPTTNNKVAGTSKLAGLSSYVLNGEQNYLKPYIRDTINVSTTPVSITHNLGYIPTAMVWKENELGAGTIAPIVQPVIYESPVFGGNPRAPHLTTTTLTFRDTGVYHYIIYLEPIYE